jgi:membrane protease YdiL (CAAX protease family)
MTTFLEYARRGRNTWPRCLFAIILAVVGWAILSIAIGVVLMLTHILPRDLAAEMQKPAHPVLFFLGNGVTFASIVAAFIAAFWLIQRKTPADIIGQWTWTKFAAGLGVWTACLIVMTLADLMIHPGGFRWTASGATTALAVSALFGLGVQTFAEEFVFRGYLTQQLLLATKRPWAAAILSGLVFGAMHIPNGAPQCANAILFGVIASLIAIRTGGIAFTWGLHLINNLFGAVIVVSAGDVFNGAPALITQTTPDLMWWDVSLGVLLLAAPVWVAWRMTRGQTAAGVAEHFA